MICSLISVQGRSIRKELWTCCPEIAADAMARTWIEQDEASVHFLDEMAARIDS